MPPHCSQLWVRSQEGRPLVRVGKGAFEPANLAKFFFFLVPLFGGGMVWHGRGSKAKINKKEKKRKKQGPLPHHAEPYIIDSRRE